MIGLAERGWNVKVIPTEEHIPEHLPEKEKLLNLTKTELQDEKTAVSINIVPAPAIYYKASYNILWCTIESTIAHDGLMRRCLMFDEVWVPSDQNRKALLKAGLKKRFVHVMPEGVDLHVHDLSGPKLEKYQSDKYTFLFIGDWSLRKGIPYLFDAYLNAFTSNDNVRLLLLTHYQGRSKEKGEGRIMQEYEEIKERHINKNPAKIEFILDYIPEPDMPKLYRTADCYILPTLGEAWSLTVIQAMAHGLPVITTKYGGHMDYCNNYNSYLIDVEKFDIMDDKTDLYVDFYKGQKFAFPSVKHLSKLLKYVYEHPQHARITGLIAQQNIIKNWSWDEAIQKVDQRLQAIQKERKC